MNNNKSMQFLYGDRELLLTVCDILAADASVVVNSTDRDLRHDNKLSASIVSAAGNEIQAESQQLIQQYGRIDAGMVVYTTAGELDYEAVLHIAPPQYGEGEEQAILERSISRSLLICETNAWSSIAFPALGVSFNGIPVELCAQAFFRSITSFWDARLQSDVEKIMLCLTAKQFDAFFHAFRNDAIEGEEVVEQNQPQEDEESQVGYIDLKDIEAESQDDDEMNEWFK